jgi:hypothetical protein
VFTPRGQLRRYMLTSPLVEPLGELAKGVVYVSTKLLVWITSIDSVCRLYRPRSTRLRF